VSLAPMPHEVYAAYLTGEVARYAGHDADAANALSQAAVRAPDQPMIAVAAARALAKAGRAADARALLAATRQRWPDHSRVWLASGDLLESSAPADAARAYRRAIELERDDERAYLGLSRVQLAQHDAAGAERTLRELVARVPDSVDGRYRLAQREIARDDLTAGIQDLRAVLELDPDHIDARLALAHALRGAGQLAAAVAETRNAFDRAGQPLDIAEELFYLLCEADDRQGAIDLLTLLDDDRSDADALAVVARLDLGLGRLDVATKIAHTLTDAGADTAAVVQLELDLANHDADAAEQHARAVPAGAPGFGEARRLAAEAVLASGHPERALDLLAPVACLPPRCAQGAAPADVELAITAADALADAHGIAAARTWLTGAVPDPAARTLALARLADHVHDVAGALALLEPYIQAHPDSATALNLAGYLLADTGQRLGDAASYLTRARQLAPGDPAVLDSWGWLLLRRGDAHGALRALGQAARFAPREPEILVHLAAAELAAGQGHVAAGELDQAATLHPPDDLLRKIRALRDTIRP
jgi:predicted Zn-dependent protease